MKLNSKSGATLAAAAATLFLAGAVVSTGSTSANAAAGKCMAGNACKGQSACKGGSNACKGQNACKGTGFSQTSEKPAPPWAQNSSRADLPTRQGPGIDAGPSSFDPKDGRLLK